MQSQESQSRGAAAVNHPRTEEWMAYLYGEIAPERKHELHEHLAQCAGCGQQLNQWRASMKSLDAWELPPLRRKAKAWQPVTLLKWAAVAAIVLCAGYAVGRMNSGNAREVAELKASVVQLTRQINQPASAADNQAITLSKQTRDELVQLLADYSKLNEEQRAEDRRVVGLALREMDLRVGKLRAELETVALNTESGFRQTKEGLTTLASYAAADHGGLTDLKSSETKN